MDVFEGLESIGFKNATGVDIFKEDEAERKEAEPHVEGVKQTVRNEEDFIFDKNMTCPVCGKVFKTKKVKMGKAHFLGTDSDLRPLYDGIDTVKYDAVVCICCGYASLERMFSNVTAHQIKEIREQITVNFKGMTNTAGPYSYDEAIQRYKLTLLNCVVRKMRISERAYICLKLAWLYRGMAKEIAGDTPEDVKKLQECTQTEQAYIQKAYEGFTMALAKEIMPICGMDQHTFNYLMADLARQCKDYGNAERFVYDIIGSRSVSAKVKEKARILHERIKQEKDS